MRIDVHRGLYRDAAGAPAGGGAAGAVADPPAGGTPAPAAGAPAKFDWTGLKLDPAIQAEVDKHQWENPGAVIQSFTNLHKLTSLPPDRLLKLPNEKSTPEEWKEFNAKIGVPAKAEDYKLPVPEGDSGEFAKEAASWMHEAGVPAGAAGKVAAKWNEHVAKSMQAAEATKKAADEKSFGELKTEWGPDFDKFNTMVDTAAARFGMTKEQLTGLREAMGPKDALKFMQKIASAFGTEGEFMGGDGNVGFNGTLTPEQAKAQLSALVKDRNFIDQMRSPDARVRQEATERKNKLVMQAGPGFIPVG